MGCSTSSDECLRSGGSAYLFFWGFPFVLSYVCIIYVVVCMSIVYRNVLKIERQAEKFRFVPRFQTQEAKKDRDRSRRIMTKGILYSGTLLLVWTFPLTFYITWLISGPSYVAYLLVAIFYPMQGIFNCCIYLSPRSIDAKKKERVSIRLIIPPSSMKSSTIEGSQQGIRNTEKTVNTPNSNFNRNIKERTKIGNVWPLKLEEEEEEEKVEIENGRSVVQFDVKRDRNSEHDIVEVYSQDGDYC
jgi:Na+-transporting methylmalonyl-CoA/oxaloacetate decarboxylase gamma subunit